MEVWIATSDESEPLQIVGVYSSVQMAMNSIIAHYAHPSYKVGWSKRRVEPRIFELIGDFEYTPVEKTKHRVTFEIKGWTVDGQPQL